MSSENLKITASSALFFVSSILPTLLLYYKRRLNDCKVSISSHSDSLRSVCSRIVTQNPFIFSPLCVLDYHGQLATAIQFFSRTALIIFQRLFHFGPKRELLPMDDGGTLAYDWFFTSTAGTSLKYPKAPLVVINHGLLGSSSSEYLVHIIKNLDDKGLNVVVVIMRGCGGLQFTSKTKFVWLQTADFKFAVANLKGKFPDVPFFALGYSLGAGVLLKYLGEVGGETPFKAAVAISPPWDISRETSVFFLWSHILVTAIKVFRFFKSLSPYVSL